MLNVVKKDESAPVMKAGIRLVYKIFSGAMDVSEFQRQVSIPNVPKMTTAMIALATKQTDVEFKVCRLPLCMSFTTTQRRRLFCQHYQNSFFYIPTSITHPTPHYLL